MQIKPARLRRNVVDLKKITIEVNIDEDYERPDLWTYLIENLLIVFIATSIIVGTTLGLCLRYTWNQEDIQFKFYLAFPGRIFLSMLQMMIIPLLTSSLVMGMLTGSESTSGKAVFIASMYHCVTATCAIAVGICSIIMFIPRVNRSNANEYRNNSYTMGDPIYAFLDLFHQIFPDNLIKACSEREVTSFTKIEISIPVNRTNITQGDSFPMTRIVPAVASRKGTNILGLVAVSIAFGYIINALEDDGQPLRLFCMSVNTVMMSIMNVIIWYTPVGIVFLIATSVFGSLDLQETVVYLTRYTCLVLGSLVFHGVVDLPFIYFAVTKQSPWLFASNVSKALFTAWGTNSSSTTIPLTVKCLITNCHLRDSVVRFMIPLSTTFNFDGAMLYESLTCIFIAQTNGFNLGLADIFVISMTASAASVCTNAIPQSSLLTTTVVLTTMGLPTEAITLILSIDWVLDRFRAVINVWGDCVGAAVLDNFSEDIIDMDHHTFTTISTVSMTTFEEPGSTFIESSTGTF